MLRVRLLAVLVLSGLLSMFSLAQAPGTGLYAFGSFDNRGFDSINIGNLNVHFEIPIVSKSGRGMPFNYKIVYDGLIWSAAESSGSQSWVPSPNWGLRGVIGDMGGYVTYDLQTLTCPPPKLAFIQTDYTYLDSRGVKHIFNYTWTAPCGGVGGVPGASGDGTTSDGSGYWFDGTNVHDAQGKILAAAVFNSIYTANGFLAIGSTTDTNGNTIAGNGSPYINGGSFTDTLGTTALTIGGAGNASSPLTFTYNVARQSDGSTTATATMSYRTYTVATNFGCYDSSGNPILNYGPLQNDLVDRITLADRTYYQFNYEDTQGISGAKTGRLASVTLPTGGTISYQYSGDCGAAINADGAPGRLVRTTSDGTRTYTRTAVNDPRSYPSYHTYTTLVQDETNNQTLYRFSSPAWTLWRGIFYETHRQVYQGSVGGTPLLDRQTCYNGITACDGLGVALPIIETTVTSSLNGGASKQTIDDYTDSNLVRESVSDYGGGVLTNTTYNYQPPGRVSQILTVDHIGNMIAQQTFGYDEQTPTSTSGLPQHIAATGPRGNATSSNVWIDPWTFLATTTTYNDAGVPLSSTGPNGTTTYSYDSTQGFATQITPPTPSSGVSVPSYSSYDAMSGVQLSASDANFPTSPRIQYSQYDKLLRPARIDRADGGNIRYEYVQGPWGNQVDVFTALNSDSNAETDAIYDDYGRFSRSATHNGQSPGGNDWYQTDYCYDPVGNLRFVSTKYENNGFVAPKQCSGDGTAYSYDALGRVTSINTADGSTTYEYNSRAVKVTDPNGVQKIIQYDAFGRITAVCEVSGNTQQADSPKNCGLDIPGVGYLTTYSYDPAGGTTTITQGAQQRVLRTDFLGRTTYTNEPERGPTTYSYSYNSTGLQVIRIRPRANQIGTLTTTTTTQYDSLSRLESITYSDGTPSRVYHYDTSIGWAEPQYNLKGRLSYIGAASAATIFSYDEMGHIRQSVQCFPSGCGNASRDRSISYTYDLAGNLLSVSNDKTSSNTIGQVTSYTYNPASEVISISNSLPDSTHPASLVSNVTNSPFGPVNWDLGNGLKGVNTYDTMGRPNGGWVCSGSAQPGCSGGNQVYGFTANWHGNRLISSSDAVMGNMSTTYDEFDRLKGFTQGSSTYSSDYDRYGNRWSQNGGSSYFSVNYDPSNNRMAGFGYDAAGNLVNDGIHTYTYDAEGNVTAVDGGSTATYTYDALNRRIRQDITGAYSQEFLFDQFNRRISIWEPSTGNWYGWQSYWGSKPLAFDYNFGIHFQHEDWIGAERIHTDYAGAIDATYNTLPFGDAYTVTGTNYDQYGYAGMDFDAVSGTNHAQFRQYSPGKGRWMSPDPYDGSYDLTNPQSFNRYVYVRNNPLGMVDPSGKNGYCLGAFPYGTAEPDQYSVNTWIVDSFTCASNYGSWVDDGSSDTTVNVNSNDPGPDPQIGPDLGAIPINPSSSGGGSSAPTPSNNIQVHYEPSHCQGLGLAAVTFGALAAEAETAKRGGQIMGLIDQVKEAAPGVGIGVWGVLHTIGEPSLGLLAGAAAESGIGDVAAVGGAAYLGYVGISNGINFYKEQNAKCQN